MKNTHCPLDRSVRSIQIPTWIKIPPADEQHIDLLLKRLECLHDMNKRRKYDIGEANARQNEFMREHQNEPNVDYPIVCIFEDCDQEPLENSDYCLHHLIEVQAEWEDRYG